MTEALAVFQVNAETYPESADVWDDLADVYAASGQRDKAVEASKKSLAIEPNGTEALELLRRLEM
jgi:predicted Zn-dependent protease